MKNKVFKYLVLASTLAFFNCSEAIDDALNNAANENQQGTQLPDTGSNELSGNEQGVIPGDPDNGNFPGSNDIGIDPITGEVIPNNNGGITEPVIPGVDPTSSTTGEDPNAGIVIPIDPGTNLDTTGQVAPNSSTTVEDPNASVVPGVSSSNVNPQSSSSEIKPESSSSEIPVKSSVFLSDNGDETKDQMRVKYIENTGDNGGGILAYPENLSNDQKHAIVLWGPGGGTQPGAYSGIIHRLASHGFVVLATSKSPDGTERGKPALDWLEKKNNDPNDPLYGKLDMTKVGCSGHSMGGLQSEKMLISDNRVITAVLNNSGALNHAELTNVPAGKTAAIVYGEGGMERPNAEGDYNNNNVKIPACLIKMTGGQGNECYNGECGWGHGSGPWGGMAATVAWMRWHLGGEDFRKSDFVGQSGKYINGDIIGERGKWKGQCKNF